MIEIAEARNQGLRKMPARKKNILIRDIRQYLSEIDKPNSEMGQSIVKRVSAMSGISKADIANISRSGKGVASRHAILKEATPGSCFLSRFSAFRKGPLSVRMAARNDRRDSIVRAIPTVKTIYWSYPTIL